MDGVRISKPFVEKPSWADDHNVHIYYPHSMVRGRVIPVVAERCYALERARHIAP